MSSSVKRAQKESLLFRTISQLFLQVTLEDPKLQGLFVNRVQLSNDKSNCTVYFYTAQGEDHFNDIKQILHSYKGPLRKAIASAIAGRYTPELIFKFDTQFEKTQRIEELLEKVKTEE